MFSVLHHSPPEPRCTVLGASLDILSECTVSVGDQGSLEVGCQLYYEATVVGCPRCLCSAFSAGCSGRLDSVN